jgi:anti-sigma regulatory factor (Ser/Thr protein kinase)
MAATTPENKSLVAFTLPGTPYSVQMARFYVRTALGYHDLGDYAVNAEIVTSELVTNAIQHVCGDGTGTVKVTLLRARNPETVTVVVTDSSPQGPVTREAPTTGERGRGLRIVDELSDYWGWNPENDGKTVYAVLAKQNEDVIGERRGAVGKIPEGQCVIAGVNIRLLRERRGWSQAKLGELMGWQSASTVCAAEGHRDGRQRGFTTEEIEQLAALFGVCPSQLTTRCANCGGHPPAGFACLACRATPGSDRSAPAARPDPVLHVHAAARG